MQDLKKKAQWVRNQVLKMIFSAKKGHIGGTFSCIEILVALYYGNFLRFDPNNPNWSNRDRFILSKGHVVVALYAILADLGFFPLSTLNSYCHNGSILGGHPDRNVPGIEVLTGALGHGLGIGAGLALSVKMDKKDNMTIVLLGDGECYEGSIWEAAMFAGHHQLNNLIAIVDRNRQSVTNYTEEFNRLEPLADKWKAFDWEVKEIDGHSFDELASVFGNFRCRESASPLMIIANTIKGKNVSFMEGRIQWHHGAPTKEEFKIAQGELSQDE